mgnify:CR=1 FL=1
MTLSEKAAYLKGLMEGMKLDTESNEGKLISEIISMLQDVAENVSDLEEVVDCISDELDCIEEDLDNIDDYLLDDEDDDDYEDYDEDEDDAEDDEYDFGDDEVLYEVKCPTCGNHHRRADARRRFHRLPELRRRAGVRSGRGRGRAEGITPCNPKTV